MTSQPTAQPRPTPLQCTHFWKGVYETIAAIEREAPYYLPTDREMDRETADEVVGSFSSCRVASATPYGTYAIEYVRDQEQLPQPAPAQQPAQQPHAAQATTGRRSY